MEDAEDEKRQNAAVLMDLLGRSDASANPFGDDFPSNTPAPASTMRSPFDTAVIAAPPVFNAYVGNAEPAAVETEPVIASIPVSDDPFATAASLDPFAPTPMGAPAFDLDHEATGVGGFDLTPEPIVPVRDDPRYRRQRDIFDAILPVLGEISMEIRRSIDYFRSRYPTDTVDQIILCGGSAQLGNLDQYVQQEMGVPTVVANPFAGLNVTSKQLSADRLHDLGPSFTVALGLAVRDAVLGTGG
jgi:hypothetical protein